MQAQRDTLTAYPTATRTEVEMRLSRPARTGAIALAMALVLGFGASASQAASLYRRDLYQSAGYERQVDSRTCVAASTAMMLNFIAGRDLDLNQLYILRWAQARDALNDQVQRGTDPLGWARAMTYFSTRAGQGNFTYRWETYTTEYIALKHAAKVIAYTGKPVGLLVQHGRHAMVMTGFDATRDPRRGEFNLVNVIISDPLGARRTVYAHAESPLNRYLETDATAYYDSAWYNRYVIVVPLS